MSTCRRVAILILLPASIYFSCIAGPRQQPARQQMHIAVEQELLELGVSSIELRAGQT